MEDSAEPSLSVGLGFARAQQQLKAIHGSSLATRSDEYQEQVHGVVKHLRQCLEQIRQLALFSSNETPDDYSTGELKLVLTTAYLGEALQKISSMDGRTAILEEAKAHYKQFLSTCRDLGIANQPEQPAEGTAASQNPGHSRMQKIERFKQQRAMQQEIDEIEARLARDSADDEDMEEVEREYAVKLIELKVHQVQDDLSLLDSELDMARQMDEMRKSAVQQQDSRAPSTEWRLDPHSYAQINPQTGRAARPTFNDRGQPMQPFVLTNKRQQIKDNVFRPGWALPTMSVDEYLEQERERGNIISGGGKEPDPKPEIDDNDYEALDAEVMKQREWDDFTDNNPRGAGNRGGNRS